MSDTMISQKPPENPQKIKNRKPTHPETSLKLMSTVVEDDDKRNVVLVIYACTHGQDCSIWYLKPKTTISTQNKYE